MRSNGFSWLLLVLVIAAMLFALGWLMRMRFESGEAYPIGSSLRADPLGAKVLFESLASVREVQVKRNFAPMDQLDGFPEKAMILMLNTWGWQMHGLANFEIVRSFVEEGGRVVVGLNPEHIAYQHLDQKPEDDAEEESETKFIRNPSSDEAELWGQLSLVYGKHTGGKAYRTKEAESLPLPESLEWREGGAFEALGDEWMPIYRVEDDVVAVERRLGEGSIVVLTDDYLFSNEAMLKHRYPSLLLWVIGDQSTVIFDETHLGVAERTGVSTLMWRYRLDGFFIGLFVFMAVVVWRGASPLLPPLRSSGADNLVLAEHSSEAGLGDLVRRSIPVSQLPREAFRIWKKAFVRTPVDEHFYSSELQKVEKVLDGYASESSLKRKPLEAHLKIKSIINHKKRKRL